MSGKTAAEHNRLYRQRHPDKVRARRRAYYLAHVEHIRERQRRRRAAEKQIDALMQAKGWVKRYGLYWSL